MAHLVDLSSTAIVSDSRCGRRFGCAVGRPPIAYGARPTRQSGSSSSSCQPVHLRPSRPTAFSRLAAATLLWFALSLVGASEWMESQGATKTGVSQANVGLVCAKSATPASASAVKPRHAQRPTAACCEDGDCVPGECPAPCRGKCACLAVHGSPLSMTTSLPLSGLVAFGPTPTSRTDLAPLLVSREPALRPPIA